MIVHQRGNRNHDWLGNNHNNISCIFAIISSSRFVLIKFSRCLNWRSQIPRHDGVQINQLKYDPYPTLQYLQTSP
jgi:hypothetical protein